MSLPFMTNHNCEVRGRTFSRKEGNETDLAWSSSLEDVRIMVRHEACPPGGNLVLMCAVVSNSASAVP